MHCSVELSGNGIQKNDGDFVEKNEIKPSYMKSTV